MSIYQIFLYSSILILLGIGVFAVSFRWLKSDNLDLRLREFVEEEIEGAQRDRSTVIIPKRNLKDLVELPKRARSELHIVLVEHIDQVLEVALNPAPVKAEAPRKGGRKSTRKEEPVVEAQN